MRWLEDADGCALGGGLGYRLGLGRGRGRLRGEWAFARAVVLFVYMRRWGHTAWKVADDASEMASEASV
jgi:hypothetical protein